MHPLSSADFLQRDPVVWVKRPRLELSPPIVSLVAFRAEIRWESSTAPEGLPPKLPQPGPQLDVEALPSGDGVPEATKPPVSLKLL